MFSAVRRIDQIGLPIGILPFFIRSKNGQHFSVDREMKRFKAAVIPVNLWTSRTVFGGFKLRMTVIWSGFASIPY